MCPDYKYACNGIENSNWELSWMELFFLFHRLCIKSMKSNRMVSKEDSWKLSLESNIITGIENDIEENENFCIFGMFKQWISIRL